MNEGITVEQFQKIAPLRLNILEEKGFKRAVSVEHTTPTTSTIVYMGEHVGFVFSFDVRDQCVDAEVVKILNGEILRNWDGGYSSDIFTHLVRHEGYRGSPLGKAIPEVGIGDENSLEKMINGWAGLLRCAGQKLFDDKSNTLP